jgi:hypothetical protein
MPRFNLHKIELLLVAAVAMIGSLYLAQETEPEVDCDALMKDFPNCPDWTFYLCTNGSAPVCYGGDSAVSPQQADGGSNATSVECEKYICFENGTYASLEDDAVGNSSSLEDDAANATSLEDDAANGTSLEDDTKGNKGTSAGPLSASVGSTAVAAAWAVAAGLLSVVM